MTTKNKDQLYASFPDNTTKLIHPVNVRDLVDSVELKYDNFTVVKPGQPNGNKFPDPVGGKITLPENTVWLVNGAVTSNYPIHIENNAVLLGLSGSINTDSLSLDSSAGAVALINSGANGTGDGFTGKVANLSLDSGPGSGRLFNIVNPTAFFCNGCLFSSINMGSASFSDGVGEFYMEDVVNFLSDSTLQFTGSGSRAVFRNIRSGFSNGINQFDLTGVIFDNVLIDSCYNSDNNMFSAVEGTTTRGLVVGNIAKAGAGLISGITSSSVNWTFSGNAGIDSTRAIGAIGIDNNLTVTDLLGVDLWAIVAGTSVLSSNSARFDRPAPSTLRYLGKTTFKGQANISLSITPTNAPTSIYQVGIFKNGALLSDSGISFLSSASMTTGVRQSISFNCPVSLETNDTLDIRVRNRTSAVPDVVVTELNFLIQ